MATTSLIKVSEAAAEKLSDILKEQYQILILKIQAAADAAAADADAAAAVAADAAPVVVDAPAEDIKNALN